MIHRTLLLCVSLQVMWALTAQHEAVLSGRLQTGIAKFYDHASFERIGRIRVQQGLIPYVRRDVDGYAAVTDCGRIGSVVYARLNGHAWESFQVLDCSHPRDVARHKAEGLVIEVDAQSARRNGFYGEGRTRAIVYRGGAR